MTRLASPSISSGERGRVPARIRLVDPAQGFRVYTSVGGEDLLTIHVVSRPAEVGDHPPRLADQDDPGGGVPGVHEGRVADVETPGCDKGQVQRRGSRAA